MSDFDEKKYKNINAIEMDIKLKDYILFPSKKIEGTIILIPKIAIPIKNSQKIIYRLTQFQRYEYHYTDITGQSGEQFFSKEDIIFEKVVFLNFDSILTKKEITFSLDLPGYEKQKLYPTFEFWQNKYFAFVRHLFTIEIPDLETTNSTGVIICKLPNKSFNLKQKDFCKNYNDSIKNYLKIYGIISYNFKVEKLSYSLNEEIPIKFTIDPRGLNNLKIDSIEFQLQKKIKIKGIISLKALNVWAEQDEKKIIVLDSKEYKRSKLKNNIMNFNEKFKIDEKYIPELSEKEVERYTEFGGNFLEFDKQRALVNPINPSIDTDLFYCKYKLIVTINFDSILKIKKTDEFELDLYNIKPSFLDDDDDEFKHIFNIDDIYINEEDNKALDFVIFEKKEQ